MMSTLQPEVQIQKIMGQDVNNQSSIFHDDRCRKIKLSIMLFISPATKQVRLGDSLKVFHGKILANAYSTC